MAKVSDGDKNDGGHEVTCDSIGELLDGSAAALRFADHADDLREQRFAADALGAHDKGAGAIYGAAGDAASVRFLDGDRLAGHRAIRPRSSNLRARFRRRELFRQDAREEYRPAAMCSTGTSISVPSVRTRRANFGDSFSSARIAEDVRLRARSSSTWPSRTRVVIAAAASK